MEKVKFQSFGKVTKKVQSISTDKELDKLYELKSTPEANKEDIDEQISNKILAYQLKEYEKKLHFLNNLKNEKGSSAAIFKLKEKIVGSKKISQEAVSMKDPETGEIIVENDKLKEASVKYVSNLLTNRNPKEDFKEEFKLMESLHEVRMKEEDEGSVPNDISDKDFNEFLKQISKKKKEKNQFILKAGNSYLNVLLAIYRKVWASEEKPSIWKNTTCIQLYKGKNRKDDFNNQRFIHTKEDVPKGFELILINKVKPRMIKNCSKFQIGAIPGHQAQEHLFTIKSVMALYQKDGKPLILQCFDLKKYFDSENLKDALNSLYHCGVKGKEYRLIYELNKENKIQIKTSVGMTNSFEVGPTVSQGSIGGGLISTINLDFSINRFFFDSNNEIFYHEARILPLIYQDDLGRFSSNRLDAQAGIDKIEACMETKLLDLHQEKSCYIVIGSSKIKSEMKNELKLYPLTLYGSEMPEKKSERYLGDFIHEGGVSASVDATVNHRYGKLIHGIKEIKAIIEDCRSNIMGGLKVGLDIWETAYIPSLLNNSSTWMEIEETTVNKLEEMQNSFYRNLFNVPYTTPKAALIWEVGGMKIKFRIMMNKILFMNHILNLDQDTLAKQVQMMQQVHESPGLTSEVKKYLSDLNLPNCFEHHFSKPKWKSLVKTAIKKANEEEIRESIKQYKKMKNVEEEEKFECKDYLSSLSLSKARTLFHHKYSMTDNVKMNFKSDRGYANSLWKCSECQNQDTEKHLLWCPGYAEHREGLDLKNDTDLCSYLQIIFNKRCNEKKQ